MSRTQAVAVENNFIKGLVTETTALKFPPNACTETYDCVFDSTGRVTRRLGIDLEDNFTLETVDIEEDEVYTEIMWNAAANLGTQNFLVIQQGNTLRFYDVSTSTDVSANVETFTVDLTDHLPTTSSRNPGIYPCDFAQGNGKLLVVNEACNPFYVEYDPTSDTVTSITITLQYRDFEGVDDGLGLTERPTNTVANLKTDNPEHYYNLLNQGWHQAAGLALTEWDTARTDMPSNVDYISLYRGSVTDIFDNARVLANSPGNSPAAKGHFILEAANPSRTDAMSDEGFTGAEIDQTSPLIHYNSGTQINSFIANPADAFDGETNETLAQSAIAAATNICLLGKTWSSPNVITKAVIYGSNDSGYIQGSNPTIQAFLNAKQGAAPVLSTDGYLLGQISFVDTSDESTGREITSNDLTTQWDHTWVTYYAPAAGAVNWGLAELEFYTTDPLLSQERPSCVEFFAGRAWYGGIKADGIGSNIYFSQIIEKDDQFGKCYQLNDPTSEELFDLLPTDGGVIKIPEMGTLTKLFATQNSLLVFASNGVWLIGGSSQAGFTANDYVVTRLSSIGTNSRHSFASIQGIPFWWAESDIYTAQYDPNYNSYKIVAVTTDSIQGFIRDIPEANRRYVKGTFNLDQSCAYWLYSTEDPVVDPYTYNRVLVFDSTSGAFYPWTIGESDYSIRGISNVFTSDSSVEPKVKLTTTTPISDTTQSISFSESWKDTYLDWTDVDYESYFITGYRIDGQGIKYFQPMYIFVYLDQEDNASCFMQGIFDFTTSNSTGKWSSTQQLYNQGLLNRGVNHRRLKLRGKGKAMQLKFTSESEKPFTLIGWAMPETTSGTV